MRGRPYWPERAVQAPAMETKVTAEIIQAIPVTAAKEAADSRAAALTAVPRAVVQEVAVEKTLRRPGMRRLRSG